MNGRIQLVPIQALYFDVTPMRWKVGRDVTLGIGQHLGGDVRYSGAALERKQYDGVLAIGIAAIAVH